MSVKLVVDGADVVVVGIDPGLTTGVAVYRPGGLFAFGSPEPYLATQVEGRFAFYDTFDQLVASGAPLVVVCESFIVNLATAKKSPQLDPLYIIGVVERDCSRLGIPFTLQTPATAKAFASDLKLKAVGWYQPGKDHANDAARHVLTYMVSKRLSLGGQGLLDQITAGVFGG